MRQSYQCFSKRNAVHSRLKKKDYTVLNISAVIENQDVLRPELSWTHYRFLLRVEDDKSVISG